MAKVLDRLILLLFFRSAHVVRSIVLQIYMVEDRREN